MTATLDVITIGRASVDLYGQQIGTGLDCIDSFKTGVGGCPANVAIGTSRLGLRSALVSRVGDEQMGHFVLRELQREGVSTEAVTTDSKRLTALVLLAVRNASSFPHIFYRENCADMALTEDDIDPAFIRRARCIVVTGTHFSTPSVAAASWKAIKIAKESNIRIVFDIDFRPSLWGLAGLSGGEERSATTAIVHERLEPVCAVSDVIVGTEEELCAATHATDAESAVGKLRLLSRATVVRKMGSYGCLIYPAGSVETRKAPIEGRRFKVKVLNTIGAGDAFLSGFLRGWLDDLSWEETASIANACGAIAVSRLLCSSEYPTLMELGAFMQHTVHDGPSREGDEINYLHWVTTRPPTAPENFIFAFDHRWQFEEIADQYSKSRTRLSDFKLIATKAAAQVASQESRVGIICDAEYGQDALYLAEKYGLWVARSIEIPRASPLQFNLGIDVGSALLHWPKNHVIKCLVHYSLHDSENIRAEHERQLLRLQAACSSLGRELLLEIIPGSMGAVAVTETCGIIARLYQLGVKPDWWKLLPFESEDDWQQIEQTIRASDKYCRGVLVLGLTSSVEQISSSFRAGRAQGILKGFAIGRSILGATFKDWITGGISDEIAQSRLKHDFLRVIEEWRKASPSSNGEFQPHGMTLKVGGVNR